MKKIFFTMAVLVLAVLFVEPTENLFSGFLLIEDDPTLREVREGDWLSKIAKEYYNDRSYWKELALINRAPNGNVLFPGEKIIVPGLRTIQEIRETRSLSRVNELVEQQRAVLNGEINQTAASSNFATDNSKNESFTDDYVIVEQTSTFNYWLLAGVIVLIASFVGGVYYYISKKHGDEVSVYGHKSESIEDIESGRSAYLDTVGENDRPKSKGKKRAVELV
jgi:hypothetical protein